MLRLSPLAFAIAAAYFTALTLWGTRLLHRVDLGGQTLLTLIPLGLVTGVAAQLLVANALSYAIRPPASFGVALALQTLSLLALRGRVARPLPSVSRGLATAAIVVAVAVAVTFAARAFTEFQQDNFREHWLDAATILEGNFPVRHPFDPDEPARYHYGTALLSAELAWVSGSAVLWSPEFLKTALVLAFMSLAFGFAAEERGVLPALLVSTILYLYVGLARVAADVAAGMEASDLFLRAVGHGQHNQFFHFPSAALFVQPMAAGWAFALAVFYILWRRRAALDGASAALVVVLLGALTLTATPEFACAIGGIAAFLVATSVGPLRRFGPTDRRWLAVAVVAAIALASLQGGVLTDFWRGGAKEAPSEYALRWPPGMIAGVDQVLTMGTAAWLRNILATTDGLALLLVAAPFAALRRPTPVKLVLLAAIGGAFALSHFVSYPSGEFNTNRPLAFAIHFALLLVVLDPPFGGAVRTAVGWTAAAIAIAGCVPGLLFDASAVGRVLGVSGAGEPSYLFWWDDPELLAAARWVRTITPRGARIATNDPMLLVSLSGRFAPNSTVDTHGHVHPGSLSADPSDWTAEQLAAEADTVCLFRSPFFQSIDIDAAALARELAAGGPNAVLVARVLGSDVRVLASGSPADGALGLNAIVRWQPRFAEFVSVERLGGPPEVRKTVTRARSNGAGIDWMYADRAALQGTFPAGTRASWVYSEGIAVENIARHAWYEPLMRGRDAGEWLAPPANEGSDRVRCLRLASARRDR